MKIWNAAAGLLACICAMLTPSAWAGNMVLARKGEKPQVTVVVRHDASPSERYAAEELVRYVEKMTDVRLPVIDDSQPLPARAVLLGMTRHTSALAAGTNTTRELGEDGFRLLSVPPHLLVMGSRKRGVLYGVYELLETYGGVGWFASWHEVVPQRDEFSVPLRLDDTQTPTFILREPPWRDMHDHADFAVRSRMNGRSRGLEPKHGGSALRFVRGLGSAHTFENLLPSGKWFKSHPEYFSEINGLMRNGRTQLCLTNPDVLRLVVSNVLAHIEADTRIREDPVLVNVAGVSPNDWRYYCKCEKCSAVDEEEGTQTGSLLRFVNRVAEEVEKVHPGFFIETLIYSYTRKPPRLVRPRHNVIPCLCSYECSFAQPLTERNLPVNASFMDDLETWGSCSRNLYLWDYTTDYSHYLYPMPNVLTLQPNIKTFRDNGVKYYFAEGGPYHADFAELKAWLIAKLSWNCDRPLEPLLDSFFEGYYGAAAPFVREYFNEVESLLRNDPKGRLTIWEHDRPRVYSDDFLRRARATFRKAEDAVRDDPVRLMHVRRQEAVPVCVWLDRKGKTVKRFWVTRHPGRFDIMPGLKEDVRWMMSLQEESKKAGRPVPVANRADKEERTFEIWRYIDEFRRPGGPCDSIALGVDDVHFGGKKFGRIVKDKTANGGKAIEAWNYAEGEAASVHFGHVAFDDGVLYRVRIHVRADAAENGRGEAFCCRFGGKTIAPRIEEMKQGWQWYEFAPRKLNEDFVLSFSSGRFSNGGGSPAVKGVRIDTVEIVREREPVAAQTATVAEDRCLPRVWCSYSKIADEKAEAADLKAHGVDVVGYGCQSVEHVREHLAAARSQNLKIFFPVTEVTESVRAVERLGETPAYAQIIGGVYNGEAIDRHLFKFSAGSHEVVVEPPVNHVDFKSTAAKNHGGENGLKKGEKIGHYMPFARPVRAEVVVPLKPFDGKQHLKVIPAKITDAPSGLRLENDSVRDDKDFDLWEIRTRRLVKVSFDLTGLDGAMLDKVGLAVYWELPSTPEAYWRLRDGQLSAAAPSTRRAVRADVRRRFGMWAEVNGGTFPSNDVVAVRFGDECFNETTFLGAPYVSYPLYDYSRWGVDAFRSLAGADIEYPRTWGYPEVYGTDAYACWMYAYHRACAELTREVVDEVHRLAPGVKVFRNTTRTNVFSLSNDRDGTGQELLARELDIVHLDPYPVTAKGMGKSIPSDMSYCAGLARRYGKPLMPWMQAHRHGGPNGLCDVVPQQVAEMGAQHFAHGIDALMWLGYGNRSETFPKARPDSWDETKVLHDKIHAALPPKPNADLAVLRPYATRAVSHVRRVNVIRNPGDWKLQQFLWVWSVELGRAYDVFEVPPRELQADAARRAKELARYKWIVSAEPYPGAVMIGADEMGKELRTREYLDTREHFRKFIARNFK